MPKNATIDIATLKASIKAIEAGGSGNQTNTATQQQKKSAKRSVSTDAKSVNQLAAELLARREHSATELKRKLRQKAPEASEQEIGSAVDALTHKDWQSDLRYAINLIQTRIKAHYGWNHIRQELRQQGVDDAIAEQALADIAPDWFMLAQAAYDKKYRGKPIVDYQDKQKRKAFLVRKGFGFDEIDVALSY